MTNNKRIRYLKQKDGSKISSRTIHTDMGEVVVRHSDTPPEVNVQIIKVSDNTILESFVVKVNPKYMHKMLTEVRKKLEAMGAVFTDENRKEYKPRVKKGVSSETTSITNNAVAMSQSTGQV